MMLCAVSVPNVGRDTILVSAPRGRTPDRRTAGHLRQLVTVDFQELGVDEALDFLHRTTGANFVLDPTAQMVPINFQATDMRLGTVVDWLAQLSGLHVSYIHEGIYFSDRPLQGGRDVRMYEVADLTMRVPSFKGPELAHTEGGGTNFKLFEGQGFGDEGEQRHTVEDLADMLSKHLNAELE